MLLRCLFALCLLHSSAMAQRRPQYNQPRSNPIPAPAGNPEATDILSQVSDIHPDGSFYTKWETANGITFEEQGQPKNVGTPDQAEAVQGSASWTTKEGERVSIAWQADENGANFQGDHLPTAPPAPEIPVLIQRALDWIAANPSKYSTDEEGQYREEDAGNARPQQQALVPRRPPPPPGRRF